MTAPEVEKPAKGTPGKWIVGGGGMAKHHERWVIRGPHGEYIARVNRLEGADANARLIAAAPELLSALRTTTAALMPAIFRGDEDADRMRAFAEVAEKAIAKAEGRLQDLQEAGR